MAEKMKKIHHKIIGNVSERDGDLGSIVAPPIVLNAEVAQPLAGGATEIDPIKPVDPIGPIRPFGEKSRVDYAGNCVYEDRALKMVLIPEGYIKADGIVGEYRYYVRDHQGNVRAVVDGEGNLVEANDYYPYGLPLPAAGGLAGDAQPYKYGGKELLTACHGGDSGADALSGLYDFGPRWQSSPTALWAQPDPEAESYPGISPYAYCAANPARYVDPTGKTFRLTAENSDFIKRTLEIYNKALGGYATVSANEEGYVSIQLNSDGNQPDRVQKLVFDKISEIIDNDKETYINIVSDSTSVLIGDVNRAEVDIKDIETIGTEYSWCTSVSTLMHETVEQYRLQVAHNNEKSTENIIRSHVNASSFEGRVVGVSVSSEERYITPSTLTITIGPPNSVEGKVIIHHRYNNPTGISIIKNR